MTGEAAVKVGRKVEHRFRGEEASVESQRKHESTAPPGNCEASVGRHLSIREEGTLKAFSLSVSFERYTKTLTETHNVLNV